jgi:hypothetical protein
MFSGQLTTHRDCIGLRARFSFVTSRIKAGPSANTLNDFPLKLDAAALQLGFDGPLGAWSENYWLATKSAQAASIRKTPHCLANPQILGSRRLQLLRAAHLPPFQNNMSRAGGALLSLSQWEGEK